MSDIQRWHDNGEYVTTNDEGEYVTYSDHVEALRQAEQDHAKAWDRATFDAHAYERGQRDALAGAAAAIRRRGGYHSAEEFAQLVEQQIKGDSDG